MPSTEASAVEKTLAWLHGQPVEYMRACNDQQLQYFSDDLEFVLAVVKPEIRREIRTKFGLPDSFGERTREGTSTLRRRVGLLLVLGRKMLPDQSGAQLDASLRALLT